MKVCDARQSSSLFAGGGILRRLGFFAVLDETHGVVDEAEEDVVGGARFLSLYPLTLFQRRRGAMNLNSAAA